METIIPIEIYVHEFELKGKTYKLKPVYGNNYKLVTSLLDVLSKDEKLKELSKKAKEGQDVEKENVEFPTEFMGLMYALAVETFVISYPQMDRETVSQFVTQNLMNLIDPVMKVNLDS